jgi:hypothetical protein
MAGLCQNMAWAERMNDVPATTIIWLGSFQIKSSDDWMMWCRLQERDDDRPVPVKIPLRKVFCLLRGCDQCYRDEKNPAEYLSPFSIEDEQYDSKFLTISVLMDRDSRLAMTFATILSRHDPLISTLFTHRSGCANSVTMLPWVDGSDISISKPPTKTLSACRVVKQIQDFLPRVRTGRLSSSHTEMQPS